VVPGGDSQEILNGWSQNPWNRSPWEFPGRVQGLQNEGIDAIKQFIQGGGGYIGIGMGGGALLCQEISQLTDIRIKTHSLGQARTYLKIQNPGHPLTFGYTGYKDMTGDWHEKIIPSMYYSDSSLMTFGGPIFAVNEQAQVIATYHDVDYEQWMNCLQLPTALTEDDPAIITYNLVKGTIILFGINPGFRALYIETYRLLSNAIFYLITQEDRYED